MKPKKIPGDIEQSVSRLLATSFPTLEGFPIHNEELELYLEDFIHMKGFVTSIPFSSQLSIYRALLGKEIEKGNPEKNKSLRSMCAIHSAFWKNEELSQQIFTLLDFLPSVTSRFLARCLPLLEEENFTGKQLGFDLVKLIITELTPNNENWKDKQNQILWIQIIDSIRLSINVLLGNFPSVFTLRKQWNVLLMLRSYLREVSFPLTLSVKQSLKFSSLMFEHAQNFYSIEFLSNLFSFLTKILQEQKRNSATKQLVQSKISLLLEIFFTEFFFPTQYNHETPSKEMICVLPILCEIIGGTHDHFYFSSPQKESSTHLDKKLFASLSLRTFLLHNLLEYGDIEVQQSFIDTFSQKYDNIFKNTKENEACLLYMHSIEDLLWKGLSASSSQEKQYISQSILGITENHFKSTASLFKEFLPSLGKARFFSSHLAEEMISFVENAHPMTTSIIEAANRLFSSHSEQYDNLLTFLLKNITKKKGVPFGQQVLKNQGLLETLPFLSLWNKTPKVREFLRKKHLFNTDPFEMIDGYVEVRDTVRKAINGKVKPLENLLASNHEKIEILLFALFQEVYVTYSLPSIPKEIQRFISFLDKTLSQNESIHPFIKDFIEFLTHNRMKEEPTKEDKYSILFKNLFILNENSTSDQILFMGVVIHCFVLAMNHSFPDNLFQWFLNSPEKLGQIFIPSMPSDRRKAMMEVLGGNWYECPNGHVYYVDACGRPTEELNCHTCGQKIGGLDHNLLETNKQADQNDQSKAGYVLSPGDEEANQPHATERDLPPSAFRLLRFFSHILLSLRFNFFKISEKEKDMILFRYSELSTEQARISSFPQFLSSDWKMLTQLIDKPQEEVSIIIHHVLQTITQHFDELFSKPLLLSSNDSSQYSLQNNEGRKQWEEAFTEKCIAPIMLENRTEVTLREYYLSNEGDHHSLLAELRESFSLQKVNKKGRNQKLCILWRHRIQLSLDHLRKEFNGKGGEYKNEYPILQLFLTEEDKLRSLQFLRAALQWQNLLSVRLDKRIDREYARNTSVAKILESLSSDEQIKWKHAWDGYKAAWNSSWRFVERFVCAEIPEMFKEIIMTDDTPLVFSLPDERDEGICPLSLILYLTDKHNQFLEQLQQIVQKQNQKGIQILPEEQQQIEYHIPTHLLTDEHLISYSVEKELVPLLQIQSIQSLDFACGSDVSYKWSRIERHIIDHVLSGKPFIDLELRKFTFANEARMSGALSTLKARISQSEIIPDDKVKIIQELGSLQNIKQLKNTLEICIGFLSASGKSSQLHLDGEIMLVNYIRETLLLTDNDLFGSSVSKVIQLRHIISLWNLLEEKLVVDPFESILQKYKQKLSEDDKLTLDKAIPKFSKDHKHRLLSIWKEMILNYLNEAGGHIQINSPIYGSLGACDDEDDTLDEKLWFVNSFPKNIEMRCCVEAYKYFES